jgi:hypothetical protein
MVDGSHINYNFSLNYIFPDEIEDYGFVKKILVARNPWDRMGSLYKSHVYLRLAYIFRVLDFKWKMPFMDFVNMICDRDDEWINTLKGRIKFKGGGHWHSQTIHALNKNGKWLPDVVVKLESIDRDWAILQAELRSDCGIELPDFFPNDRVEPSHDLTYAGLYAQTPATIDMVAERYAQDIALLGYEDARPTPTEISE